MDYQQMITSIQSVPDDATVETKKTLLRTIALQLLRERESLIGLRTRAAVTIISLNEVGQDITSNWLDAELFEYEVELQKRLEIKNLCSQC